MNGLFDSIELDTMDLGLEETWTEWVIDRVESRGIVVVPLSSRALYGP